MPRGSICAEIGVWRGNFSAQILKRVGPRKLHLIDPWKFESDPAYSRAWYGGGGAKSQQDMDRIFFEVCDRFREEIAAGVVKPHRASSSEAAALFQEGYFDWVYIDGNHLYEFVIDDLETYAVKVKPQGFIAGDDYGNIGWWEDGVRRAVDDFSAAHSFRLTLMQSQFILTRQ